jgi:transposase
MDGKAAELKALAKASVGIRLGEDAAAMQVQSLVRQMDFLDGECGKVERRVRELLEPVGPLVLAIPGISYTTGAQTVAEVGGMGRFRSASALVGYAGLNSSVNQSGKFDSGGGPITKHGSPCLRRALWLAANSIVFAVMRDGVPYDPARPGRDPSKHPVSGSQGAAANECESVR